MLFNTIKRLFLLSGAAMSTSIAMARHLQTAADLADFLDGAPADKVTFTITGVVQNIESKITYILDDSGAVDIYNSISALSPGDKVILNGIASFHVDGNASAQTTVPAASLGKGPPPEPTVCELDKINSRAYNRRLLSVVGTVHDILRDEIDPGISFLILKKGSTTLPVAIKSGHHPAASELQDTTVRVEGLFRRRVTGHRYFFGPFLYALGPVTAIASPRQGPFDHPRLSFYPLHTSQELYAMSKRTISGRVLGSWQPAGFLLRADEKRIVRVDLLEDSGIPKCGDLVEVAGYPSTDLFHINLSRAVFQHIENDSYAPNEESEPFDIADEKILNRHGTLTSYALTALHGRLGRISGELRETGDRTEGRRRYALRTRHCTLTVDVSGLDPCDMPIGAKASVTGFLMLEGENWSPAQTFPHMKGIVILPRSPDDVKILSRPPWLTRRRLLAVIAVLMSAICGILVWNRMLNRLVVRQSNELAREQVAASISRLRADERTHLAVELHDSLSQNLEGVACQMAASESIMADDPARAAAILSTAVKMLGSCRSELRRCLFDLRSDAIADQDFGNALRKTLEPVAADAALNIRFDISRAELTEHEAHTVISIVRELVSNAIRHGHATRIQIAGAFLDGVLKFSVQNNGTPLDAGPLPGPAQGHFGLQGIRERIRPYNGSMEMISQPGAPVRVKVTMTLRGQRTQSHEENPNTPG